MPGSIYDGLSPAQFAVCNFISDSVRKAYELKVSFENPDALKDVERYTILSAIDKLWQEHLYEMDSLRNSIGLRAYGQRDPLIEYKAEAFKIFEELMVNIKTEICHNIFRSASSLMAFENFLRNVPQQTTHQSTSAFGGAPATGSDAADGQATRNGPRKAAILSAKRPLRSKGQARPRRAQSRPQRSLPLQQREEIQALLRENLTLHRDMIRLRIISLAAGLLALTTIQPLCADQDTNQAPDFKEVYRFLRTPRGRQQRGFEPCRSPGPGFGLGIQSVIGGGRSLGPQEP